MSCEDFLDTVNLEKYDTTSFPKVASDAEQMVTGVYSKLNQAIASPAQTLFFVGEIASDDRLGGGGENDKHFMAYDKMMQSTPDQFPTFWQRRYEGIFRATMALQTLGQTDIEPAVLDRYLGEVHFLRAFYLSELAEFFGEVPLPLTTEAANLPRADIDLIYGQIAYDLQEAIKLLPGIPYNATVSGHATKWAAQSLLARIFLFYTGFYSKTDMPIGDGAGANTSAAISKQQVIDGLNDVIANSGHSLVSEFRQLWSYSNSATAPEYPYVADLVGKNQFWLKDLHGETVFAVKYSSQASWSNGSTNYSNQYAINFGLRADNGGENTFPFGVGWGAGPVNSQLWDEWKTIEPDDPRRKASILCVLDGPDSEIPEGQEYIWGADKQMEETGYWQKKYTTIRAHDTSGKLKNSYSSILWANEDQFQLSWPEDFVIIRYADILLMHSELTETATGINLVRARVGLPEVTYSTQALRNERRFELAFEGRRWTDIRRWGIAADVLAKQAGVKIWNRGLPEPMKEFGGGYKARYEATKGFFQIPKTQLDLSNGMLEQTPGWGKPEQEFTNW
jgi:hypothetical protein